eukprot:403363535
MGNLCGAPSQPLVDNRDPQSAKNSVKNGNKPMIISSYTKQDDAYNKNVDGNNNQLNASTDSAHIKDTASTTKGGNNGIVSGFLQQVKTRQAVEEENNLNKSQKIDYLIAHDEAYFKVEEELDSQIIDENLEYVYLENSNGVGSVYRGYVKSDGVTFEGPGSFRFSTAEKKLASFHGRWVDGKINGYGKAYFKKGHIYEGEFQNGLRHGFGHQTNIDGSVYDGHYVQDQKHGQGKEVFPDGAVYEGTYRDNKKHGEGKLSLADGSTYEGEFQNNLIQGYGKYHWVKDGREYEGTWLANKMHGKGRFTWQDGRVYEGDYLNDKKHGQGVFNWPDGRKYDGEWKDGNQDGEGMFYSKDGQVKKGLWNKGQREKWL